jgi:hypothetical protein
MLYAASLTLALPVGPGFLDYVLRLNSLFDPDFSGGGHQPKGFDQLAVLYNRYRVYDTHWRIFLSPAVVGAPPKLVAVVPTNATGLFANVDAAAEAYKAQTGVITDARPAYISGSVHLPLLNGKTQAQYAADDLTSAVVTADPSEALALHIVLQNLTGLAENINVFVQLHYECEFFDPQQIPQS